MWAGARKLCVLGLLLLGLLLSLSCGRNTGSRQVSQASAPWASRTLSLATPIVTQLELDPSQVNRLGFQVTLQGDANGDMSVGFADVNLLVEHFGAPPDDPDLPAVDFNLNGQSDFGDVNILVENFGVELTRFEVRDISSPPNPLLELSPDQGSPIPQGVEFGSVFIPSPDLAVRVAVFGRLSAGGSEQLITVSPVFSLNDPLLSAWDSSTVVWRTDELIGLTELSSGRSGVIARIAGETGIPWVWDETSQRLIFYGENGGQVGVWATSLDGSAPELMSGNASLPGTGPVNLILVSPTGDALYLSRGEIDPGSGLYPQLYLLDFVSKQYVRLGKSLNDSGFGLFPGDWFPDGSGVLAGVIDPAGIGGAQLYKFSLSDPEGSQYGPLGLATGFFAQATSGDYYLVAADFRLTFEFPPQVWFAMVSAPVDPTDFTLTDSPTDLVDSSFAGKLPNPPFFEPEGDRVAFVYVSQTDPPVYTLVVQDFTNPAVPTPTLNDWPGDGKAAFSLSWVDADHLLSLTGDQDPGFILSSIPAPGTHFVRRGPGWQTYQAAADGKVVSGVGDELWVYPKPTEQAFLQEDDATKVSTGVGADLVMLMLPGTFAYPPAS